MRDYRDILKDELERRIDHNPRYSLRAFARDLQMPASRLSEVLNERRGLSGPVAVKVARRLGLAGTPKEAFLVSVAAQHARSAAQRTRAKERLAELAADEKRLGRHTDPSAYVVAWHYAALVELARTDGFRAEPAWIAHRLGISEFQVTQAVRYLKRKEYLVATADGGLAPGPAAALDEHGLPKRPLRLAYDQVLARARQDLGLGPHPGEDYVALPLALARSQVPKARRLVRELERALLALSREPGPKDEVRLLALQFLATTTQTKG